MGWKRYAGAISGAALGYIGGNVPGAVAGGYFGYNASENLPKQNSMARYGYKDSGYSSASATRGRNWSPKVTNKKRKWVVKGASYLKSKFNSTRAKLLRRGGKAGAMKRAVPKTAKLSRAYGTVHNTGTYSGRFKKAKKIKRTIESLCLSKGYHKTLEQFGTVADPDCVYIAHSTGYIVEVASTISTALIRKIFTKCNFKITNSHVEMGLSSPVAGLNQPFQSDGIRLCLTTKDSILGSYENFVYDTVDNQTFWDIVHTWNDLRNRIIDYMRVAVPTTSNGVKELYRLAVYTRDATSPVTNIWNLKAEMFLQDCKLELFFQSNLTIQNRTLGALASEVDESVDRIDNQPLKGYIYEFKHADPRGGR